MPLDLPRGRKGASDGIATRFAWLAFSILPLGIVCAFAADTTAKHSDGADEQTVATVAVGPTPCDGQSAIPTPPIIVCEEDGGNFERIPLVDTLGSWTTTVPAGSAVRRLSGGRGEPASITRAPGHVDVRVCVADGESANRIGFVKITTIFAGPTCPNE